MSNLSEQKQRPSEAEGREFRCFCRTQRLLAFIERRPPNKSYVHIKSHKSGKVLSDVILKEGTAEIRCPACGRAHSVVVDNGRVTRD